MGFELNEAPAFMKAIFDTVLAKDESVFQATSAYIDDIYVNEDVTSATCVRQHFADFGLTQNNWRTIPKCSACKFVGSKIPSAGSWGVKYQRDPKF